jgi:protoporphyrinogen/coproporphyrinogen III oxidase
VSRPRVVVVGGGLTGLATAWHLRGDAEVTVLEADDRVGGQIRTVEHAGVPFDVGADAFLARQPEAEALARAAGFGDDDLVAPATGQVHLWVRERLRPLPDGTVLGAPTDLCAVARARVLSPLGLARAACEPLVPRRRVVGDRAVADLVTERFGREVADVLVEPLLGGVYAGNADQLSAQAAAPAVWAAARSHRSLTRGLRAHRARIAGDERPVFLTLRGGLGTLVERLADDLGASVRTSSEVTELMHRGDHGWAVTTANGVTHPADQLVLALPARRAATLLSRQVKAVARELSGIRAASVGVVALAYEPADARDRVVGSGVLVPRTEGRTIKAATFSSSKWPHHADRDHVLVRASVGRIDERAALAMADDELLDRVDAELRWATGIRAPAVQRRLIRWTDALPQYDVGHVQRVDRIRRALRDAPPGLHLAGASYDGVGLAARAREASHLAAAIRGA